MPVWSMRHNSLIQIGCYATTHRYNHTFTTQYTLSLFKMLNYIKGNHIQSLTIADDSLFLRILSFQSTLTAQLFALQ